MAKSAMAADSSLLPSIAARICLLRGKRTLLDSDLAKLYGVPTKRFKNKCAATSLAFHMISCFS
jgi:hypothetical protein